MNIGSPINIFNAERWFPVVPEKKMIRVRVYLPPYLERPQLDKQGYAQIEKGSTLKDLFLMLHIPFSTGAIHLCRLNYEKASLKNILKDGDTVSFYSLISGG